MTTSIASTNNNTAFQLKGSLLTLTVLQLLQTDSLAFALQLSTLVKKTPNFFKNAPVVIDLEKLQDTNHSIDFAAIKAELIKYGLLPVGIRNANEQQTELAIAAGLGVLAAGTATRHIGAADNPASRKSAIPKVASKQIETVSTCKIITQPVRSGQQIYAQGGDLVILASVSAGAELMADGNIHVYGTLRGRALAGVAGNTAARIFCHKLDAELISIAGYYKLRDDMVIPAASELGIQVYFEDGKLSLAPI